VAPGILGFLIMRVPKSDAQRNICLVSGIFNLSIYLKGKAQPLLPHSAHTWRLKSVYSTDK
jgi:hypothetical protein